MKNNPLDDIVKCTVEISSPASSDATFDTILMIVPGPSETGKKTMAKTTPVSSADELLDYGFTVNDTAYSAATVAFSQNPSPDEIYVCIRAKKAEEPENPDGTEDASGEPENKGSGTDEAKEPENTGTEAQAETVEEYEDIRITLARAKKECGFYGIYISDFRDTVDIENTMEWTEANEKVFGFEYIDYDKFPVKNFSYYRTFAMFSGLADGYEENEQPKANRYAALAWMAKCFGYDPGTETWMMKELATVMPSALDTAQKKELEANNTGRFLRYGGCNVTIGGNMLAGEWIDVIRFRDWIKNEMQIRVFNVVKVNRKVPFTDAGIAMIEGQMIATLKKGQEVGGIADTEYDDDGNATPGFTVTVPRALDFTEAERKSRKLTGCKYTARLAGAIHVVEIYGFLTF